MKVATVAAERLIQTGPSLVDMCNDSFVCEEFADCRHEKAHWNAIEAVESIAIRVHT